MATARDKCMLTSWLPGWVHLGEESHVLDQSVAQKLTPSGSAMVVARPLYSLQADRVAENLAGAI